MKIIQLSKGFSTAVDDEDYEWLNQWKWCYAHGYAIRSIPGETRQKNIFMHRVIMNTPDNMATDHIDGDKLNNVKSNLRVCNKSQNGANRNKSKNNNSGYKGIWKNGVGWSAKIVVDGIKMHLGTFRTPEEAAKVYDREAIRYFGEFANTNFSDK